MNLFIIFILEFIAHVICIDIQGVHFTVINNKRGNSEMISHINVDSLINCAVHCSVTQGCSQANFVNRRKCLHEIECLEQNCFQLGLHQKTI